MERHASFAKVYKVSMNENYMFLNHDTDEDPTNANGLRLAYTKYTGLQKTCEFYKRTQYFEKRKQQI